jgi:hypothetical protein
MIIPSIDVAGTPAAWTMEALILVATSGGATMLRACERQAST